MEMLNQFPSDNLPRNTRCWPVHGKRPNQVETLNIYLCSSESEDLISHFNIGHLTLFRVWADAAPASDFRWKFDDRHMKVNCGKFIASLVWCTATQQTIQVFESYGNWIDTFIKHFLQIKWIELVYCLGGDREFLCRLTSFKTATVKFNDASRSLIQQTLAFFDFGSIQFHAN